MSILSTISGLVIVTEMLCDEEKQDFISTGKQLYVLEIK
jgi:hypothetical protein